MKKLITFSAALALALPLATSAFAADNATSIDSANVSAQIGVQAKYNNSDSGIGYKVDVEWGDMQFTYTPSSSRKWDSDAHKYTDGAGTWTPQTDKTGKITVTNHSNTGIKVNFTYLDAGYDLTGTLTPANITLPTAEGKTKDDSNLSGTTTFSLSGDSLPSYVTDFTKVGTINVAISKSTT